MSISHTLQDGLVVCRSSSRTTDDGRGGLCVLLPPRAPTSGRGMAKRSSAGQEGH